MPGRVRVRVGVRVRVRDGVRVGVRVRVRVRVRPPAQGHVESWSGLHSCTADVRGAAKGWPRDGQGVAKAR